MPDNKSKSVQHIWPIFVIAVLLGIFGFGLALKSTPEPLPVRNVERIKFEAPVFEKRTEPYTFVHKNLTRKYNVFIKQEGVLSTHKNGAFFSFLLVDEKKSDTVLHRTFENAAIEIYTDKKQIDAPISFDVARLLQTTKYEITTDKKGNRAVKLISSDPGKLRSVLRLIKSSLMLLDPTYPDGAIKPNEKWDYGLPKENTEFKGTRTLVGQTKDNVIIRQTVDQPILLKAVKAHVSGTGISVVSKTDGGLEEGTLTLQSIVELKDRKHVSSTTIVVKAIQ